MKPDTLIRAALLAFALEIVGCAAWDHFTEAAAPVVAAACATFEARACEAHTSLGIPEADPRAVAAHAAGRAADRATPAQLASALDALAASIRAF